MDARLTSEVEHFPHGDRQLCYIELPYHDDLPLGGGYGTPTMANRFKSEFREAVQRTLDGYSDLYVVWPGQYRSDLFKVDDLDVLAKELGLP